MTSPKKIFSQFPVWPFIGHAALGHLMISGLDAGTFPDVSLFSGPRHVGKSSAATWLAQRERCLDATQRPCGQCLACRQVASGQHPLVICLDAGSQDVTLSDVRLALARWPTRLTPPEHRWLLIFEVDRLRETAGNAILKFLEDLPSQTHVIMTTSHPLDVLPTIRSRAAIYRWHLVQRRIIEEWLRTIAPRLPASHMTALVARSAGRPGLARTGLDTVQTEEDSLAAELQSWQWIEGAKVQTDDSKDEQSNTQLLYLREVLLTQIQASRRLWPERQQAFVSLANRAPLAQWLAAIERQLMAQSREHLHLQSRLWWYDLHLV